MAEEELEFEVGGRHVECDAGWFPLLRRLDRALRWLDPDYTVEQVKEKFGTLRFYATPSSEGVRTAFYAIIGTAEAEAERTCERCGKPGVLFLRNRWLKTLCTADAAELGFTATS